MKQLLETGVYFDHQTRRWNPRIVEYTFTEYNGIYITDLQKTMKKLEETYSFVHTLSEEGRPVPSVGIKKQARSPVRKEAERAGACHVSARWLGGIPTNFRTVHRRTNHLNQLKTMEKGRIFKLLPKKEVVRLHLEIERLEKFLGDIKNMRQVPGVPFIVDPRKERIAIVRAEKLGIPTIATVDTNYDPDEIDYVTPGNDNAIHAVKLISVTVANVIAEGREGRMGATAAEEREEVQAE